jgi:hypothetical protein
VRSSNAELRHLSTAFRFRALSEDLAEKRADARQRERREPAQAPAEPLQGRTDPLGHGVHRQLDDVAQRPQSRRRQRIEAAGKPFDPNYGEFSLHYSYNYPEMLKILQ